jgi:hypothetical protein
VAASGGDPAPDVACCSGTAFGAGCFSRLIRLNCISNGRFVPSISGSRTSRKWPGGDRVLAPNLQFR